MDVYCITTNVEICVLLNQVMFIIDNDNEESINKARNTSSHYARKGVDDEDEEKED